MNFNFPPKIAFIDSVKERNWNLASPCFEFLSPKITTDRPERHLPTLQLD